MKPILCSQDAVTFNEGIGSFDLVTSCNVIESINNRFEMTMDVLASDPLLYGLNVGSIISVKPNMTDPIQPFVVEQITKNISGEIGVYATHIGQYRSKLIPVRQFNATSLSDALTKIKTNSLETNIFNLSTDKSVSTSYVLDEPRTMRDILGGTKGSILDIYGGEYYFDGLNISLLKRRGNDNRVYITFGTNMVDYVQSDEFNWSQSITGILPYFKREENGTTTLVVGDIQYSTNVNDYPYKKTIPYNFTEKFNGVTPTKAQLNAEAIKYLQGRGKVVVSFDVSFEDFSTLPIYNDLNSKIGSIQLGDTVHIINSEYNVSVSTRIRELNYNVLLDRYETISIGDATTSINDAISDAASSITNIYGSSFVGGTGIEIDNDTINNVFSNLSNVDLNNIKYNFQGYVSGATNTPTGYSSGNLNVYGRADQLICEQIFTPYNKATPMFVRNYTTSGGSGSWTAWKKISDCYEAGDTINLGYFDCSGHSVSATQFIFSIPINKPIAASNVTFNKLQVTAYNQDGVLINNIDLVADSRFTITASVNNNGINVLITRNTSFISDFSRPMTIRLNNQTSISFS